MPFRQCHICMMNERHFQAQLLWTGWPTWRMWAAAVCCRRTRSDPRCCSLHQRPSWTHSCYTCSPLRRGWFQSWKKRWNHIEEPWACNLKQVLVECNVRWSLVYLWPISWAMVIPRSKPVSSVITQLHSLEQAPPNCATPLTCLFPSGNTRSYLFVVESLVTKTEFAYMKHLFIMQTNACSLHTV